MKTKVDVAKLIAMMIVVIFGLVTAGQAKGSEDLPLTNDDKYAVIKIRVSTVSFEDGTFCGKLMSIQMDALEMPLETTVLLFTNEESLTMDDSLGVVWPFGMVCWGVFFQSGSILVPSYVTGTDDQMRVIGFGQPVLVELEVVEPGTETQPSNQIRA